MTALIVIGGIVTAFIALVLILPCPACARRRARMKAAYEEWRRTHGTNMF
jgi:hypothetical protein